jgi:prepilin-type N-terminal cleavage/methylation domain-containing protein
MLTMSRMRNEKGFTLIELLIVIVVLGILAAIVLFAVGSARDDANTNACAADRKTLDTAEEAHKAKNGGNYVSEATLVSAGFLKSESTKWNINLVGGGTSYTFAAQANGGC